MILLMLIFILSLSVANFKDNSSKKPHIITILVDDLGWNDLSFHGSDQIPTPNIDALAYSGMILNRHYVLPTCTPSRTALLTGSYPIRHGMHGYPMKAGEARGIPLQAKLLPQYLKDLGYKTHMVGKWHLGYMKPDYLPNHRGFDSFFGYYNGYTEYFKYGLNQSLTVNHSKAHFYGYDLHFNDIVNWKDKGNYATRLFTERAVDVIKQHDSNNPLFMYLSHLAVHTGTSEGLGLEIPDDIDVNKTFSYIKDYPRRLYAAMVQELDKSVGAVIEALNDAQMLENSIILLMADNGAQPVSVDMQPNYGSNYPLRGAKFTMYEGGVRGTALIWSPRLLQGLVSDQFIHISDWLPTFYRAAGGNPDDLEDVDGIDQWTALGKHLTIRRDHILLNIDEIEGHEGIILHDRWKVVKGGIMNYANYDYHWGKESYIMSPPNYDFQKIAESQAGRSILSILGYENTLDSNVIRDLRENSTVVCDKSYSIGEVNNQSYGEVDGSREFFCLDYCLFDIIEDPCELNEIDLDDVKKLGIETLNSFRKELVNQTNGPVDINSNPEYHGGVWLPWMKSGSSKVNNSILNLVMCHLVLAKLYRVFCA